MATTNIFAWHIIIGCVSATTIYNRCALNFQQKQQMLGIFLLSINWTITASPSTIAAQSGDLWFVSIFCMHRSTTKCTKHIGHSSYERTHIFDIIVASLHLHLHSILCDICFFLSPAYFMWFPGTQKPKTISSILIDVCIDDNFVSSPFASLLLREKNKIKSFASAWPPHACQSSKHHQIIPFRLRDFFFNLCSLKRT